MHGQFYCVFERPSVDKEKCLPWFCSSGLNGETDSLIIALNSHIHQKNIMKQPTDSKCRMCCKAEEHVTHIVAGCTILALSNTLVDTIRWLVTSTERYVNIWGYTLLTSTMNIYLTVSWMSAVPVLCGTYRLSQMVHYYQTDPIYYCIINKRRLAYWSI